MPSFNPYLVFDGTTAQAMPFYQRVLGGKLDVMTFAQMPGAEQQKMPATAADRALAEAVIRTTGDALWVEREDQLDAVTALSGSGPAYVFYFLEAMQQAGVELGLTPEQARALAVGTFAGGAHLAAQSAEPLATLRERVTSKGGTTHAALTALEQAGVKAAFVKAMHAACVRAAELGDEFGRTPPH